MADDEKAPEEKKPESDAPAEVKPVDEAKVEAAAAPAPSVAASEAKSGEKPVAAAAPRPLLILVTDGAYKDDRVVEVAEACAKVLPPGAFCVQLRDKRKDLAQLRAFAVRLREVTKANGAKLLVNGNPQLAKEIGADGVHLGGNRVKVAEARELLGPGAFVTTAAHSDEAVRLGAGDGADGALVSSIFAVPGKAIGRGVDALRSARGVTPPRAKFAIYALGGIDRTNAGECVAAGADGVAAIRALLLASDPAAEARAMHEAILSARPST